MSKIEYLPREEVLCDLDRQDRGIFMFKLIP
jgi:hypothetical protein